MNITLQTLVSSIHADIASMVNIIESQEVRIKHAKPSFSIVPTLNNSPSYKIALDTITRSFNYDQYIGYLHNANTKWHPNQLVPPVNQETYELISMLFIAEIVHNNI